MIKRSNLCTALLDKVVNIPVIQITLLVILFILVFQSYLTCFLKALKNTTMFFTCIAVFHMFSLSAQTPRKDSGANGPTPLQIGDTIPESLWSTPLQVVNHSDGKKVISLNDYRGRLIILDFWATWCSPCVAALPKLQKLQAAFSDQIAIVPITFQKEQIVNTFIKRNEIGKKLNFSLVTGDTLLSTVFPHQLLSHLVWIDKKGILRATTWSEYANAANISMVLEGKVLNWTMKNDMLQFNKDMPLLTSTENGAPVPSKIYYTMFSGHLNGVNPTVGTSRDSIAKSVRKYFINVGLVNLCVIAWGKSIPELSAKQYVYPTAKKSMYVRPEAVYSEDWNRENTYCYEAVMPEHTSSADFNDMLAQDLKRYFGIAGYLNRTNMQCLVIRSTKTARNSNKVGIKLSDLIWTFNNTISSVPLIVDETNDPTKLVSSSIMQCKDLISLRTSLEAEGYACMLEDREIETFTIHKIR